MQLLNGIEKQRSKIRSHLAEIRAENILNKLGEPIKWIGYRSKKILSRKGELLGIHSLLQIWFVKWIHYVRKKFVF